MWIQGNALYAHKVMRVNFSTYDVRRGQDSLNPRKDTFIMTLARDWDDTDHPYSYAQVLSVFHVDVSLRDVAAATSIRPMSVETKEVLWVRWFRLDKRWKGGFRRRRLYRVELVPTELDYAYGFLDPDDVIRAAYLVPAYAHCVRGEHGEWPLRYVNMYVFS